MLPVSIKGKKLRKILIITALTTGVLGGTGGYLVHAGIIPHYTSLSVAPHISENDLEISDKLGHRAAESGAKIVQSPGHYNNHYHLGAVVGNEEIPSTDSGSPFHNGREHNYFDVGKYYDLHDINYFHSYLAKKQLTGDGSSDVMRTVVPNNASAPIEVEYPDAAYVSGVGKVSVGLKIDGFQDYNPWRGKRSFVFGRNLADGFRFNGFTNFHVTYNFIKNGHPINLDGSYMSFHHLDGEASYGRHPKGYSGRTGQQDFRNNEVWVHSHQRRSDPTGQSISSSMKGYVTKGSSIRRYYSNAFHGPATGGMYAVPLSHGSHTVMYKLNGQYAEFATGSAMGYGKMDPSTKLIKEPVKTQIHKSASVKTLKAKGQQYTYNITGTLPKADSINGKYKYEMYDNVPHEDTVDTGQGGNPINSSDVLPGQVNKSQNENINTGDEDGGLPDVKRTDDRVSFSMNAKQIKAYEKKHGQKYDVKVTVNANNIPDDFNPMHDPDKDATHTGNSYTYYNEAHTIQVYPQTPNGTPRPHRGHSNFVPTTIRKRPGTPAGRRPKRPTPPNPNHTPLYKSVHKEILHHPGERDTYTITGHLPHRNARNSVRWVPTGPNGQGFYQWYDGHKSDHFDFDDTLPKEDQVTSANLNGGPISYDGHHVHFHLNSDELDRWSGQKFTIKIHFKASHLPKITHQGWLTWWNQAHDNQQIYGNQRTEMSNRVPVKIRKVLYKIWHYDFNWKNHGRFFPESEQPNGNNWQYHKYFRNNGHVPNGDILNPDPGYKMPSQKDVFPGKPATGYTYEGSRMNIPVYQHSYKDQKHQWRYRYLYGHNKKNATPIVKYNKFQQSFWLPYIVPRAKIGDSGYERFIVDTAKQGSNGKYGTGLPFRFDVRDDSYLYKEFKDYDHDILKLDITDPDHPGTGLFHGQVLLDKVLKDAPHGRHYVEFRGHLATDKLPKLSPGSRVPLHAHLSVANPNHIQVDTHDLNTHGYIASEDNISSGSFNGDKATKTEPERTVKYLGNPNVREIDERLKITQPRNAAGKTGYGISEGHDIQLQYQGHLHASDYGYNGSDMDYSFPRVWNQSTNTQKPDSDIKYRNDPYDHKSYGAGNQQNSHYTFGVRMLADAFMHAQEHFSGGKLTDLDDSRSWVDRALDDISYWASAPRHKAEQVDSAFDHYFPQDANEGTYTTNYKFYPRMSVRDDKNSPKGNVALARGYHDPFASNKLATDGGLDSVPAGNRMFTPYWLGIKGAGGVDPNGRSFSGSYPNYFEKRDKSSSDKGRLGGNWLNIDEQRAILMYAHMALSKQSEAGTNEPDDEISIQPYLPSNDNAGYKGQNVQGFTQHENDELKGHGDLH